MSTAIKDVDIDPQGVFKYILIQVSSPDESGKFQNKMIVRGYSECPYHADIDDKVTQELQGLKTSGKIKEWKSKVLGGGRIKHDPEKKVIEVYGYSQGFGKADHEKTVGILKSSFAGYNITWSDEGY